MAIWVPSVTNLGYETEPHDARNPTGGYSSVSPRDDAEDRGTGGGEHLELSIMNNANILRSIDGDVFLEGLKVDFFFPALFCCFCQLIINGCILWL